MPLEKAAVDRLQHILRINLLPQPGVEARTGQADEASGEAVEDMGGSFLVAGRQTSHHVLERVMGGHRGASR